MTKSQVYARIERDIAAAGSARRWAISLGLDPSYAARLRRGKVELQPSFLAKLGLERITLVTYREKRP